MCATYYNTAESRICRTGLSVCVQFMVTMRKRTHMPILTILTINDTMTHTSFNFWSLHNRVVWMHNRVVWMRHRRIWMCHRRILMHHRRIWMCHRRIIGHNGCTIIGFGNIYFVAINVQSSKLHQPSSNIQITTLDFFTIHAIIHLAKLLNLQIMITMFSDHTHDTFLEISRRQCHWSADFLSRWLSMFFHRIGKIIKGSIRDWLNYCPIHRRRCRRVDCLNFICANLV